MGRQAFISESNGKKHKDVKIMLKVDRFPANK